MDGLLPKVLRAEGRHRFARDDSGLLPYLGKHVTRPAAGAGMWESKQTRQSKYGLCLLFFNLAHLSQPLNSM